MYITTKQCKLFSLAISNFTLTSSVGEIQQILGGVFVVEEEGEGENLVGLVSYTNNYFVKDGFIYGDIEVGIRNDENDYEFEFVGASVKVGFTNDEYREEGRIASIEKILVKKVYK